MISVEALTFEYPGVRALDGVAFELPRESITAMVGPNGAGKSTLLRCIAGLETPLTGRVRLGELDVHERPRDGHRLIGFLSDFYGLYDDLSVARCLSYRAGAMEVPPAERRDRVSATATRCGLSALLERRAGELSRGQRQRLAIAQALVHGPEVLLLDEPASGLDPEARHALSALLRDLRGEGLTIVVSSHILSELEDYSTHMLALDRGRLRDFRPIAEPGEVAARQRVRLALAQPDARLESILEGEEGLSALSVAEGEASFDMAAAPAARAALLRRLVEAGLPVAAFELCERNMEQAYLTLMGERSA